MTSHGPEFHVQNNTETGSYDAVADDRVVGMVVYRLHDKRIVLTHTIVDNDHRGKGIATSLVGGALEDIAAKGLTLTNYCPFVADYIADHPTYKALVDPHFPGAAVVPDRAPRPYAEEDRRLPDTSVHDRRPLSRRSSGLGPLARAQQELAETIDDLATARDLAADDDTFAVEADMLDRRLPRLKARLAELLASADRHESIGDATVWEEATKLVVGLKVDQATDGADLWNTALDQAAQVLARRGRAINPGIAGNGE
jgi:uncharacterized protein